MLLWPATWGTCNSAFCQRRAILFFASHLSAVEPATNGHSFRGGFKKHSGCGSAICKLCFYLHAHDSYVWEDLCVLPDTLVPGSYSVFPPIVCRLLPSCFSFVMREIKIKWAGPWSRNYFRYSLATEADPQQHFPLYSHSFFLTGQYDKLLISGQAV